MIKTQNLVPEVYYNRSRDFQLLGRIYEIVFNYLKMNSDTIYDNPFSDNSDDKLIALVASTLGFKEMHEYNTQQLRALCSTFAKALRCKGTLKSVEYLLNLLLNVEHIKNAENSIIERDVENPYQLNIFLPLEITDTSLFEDMLYYVLPAGMTYRMIKQLVITYPITDTLYVHSDYITDQNGVKLAVSTQAAYEGHISKLHTEEDGTTIKNSAELGVGRIEDMNIVKTDKASEYDQEEKPKKLPRKKKTKGE